jgi:hypothetical protein
LCRGGERQDEGRATNQRNELPTPHEPPDLCRRTQSIRYHATLKQLLHRTSWPRSGNNSLDPSLRGIVMVASPSTTLYGGANLL